jgi:hypothetical protein
MKWKERPSNVPRNPDVVYKDKGWIGWGHFLGTYVPSIKKTTDYLPFGQALPLARKAGIKSSGGWRTWKERPDNLPKHPDVIYKKRGWVSWPHWLRGREPYLSFDDALGMARTSRIVSVRDWYEWPDRPSNLPKYPQKLYRNRGWISWEHWLGPGSVRSRRKRELTHDLVEA